MEAPNIPGTLELPPAMLLPITGTAMELSRYSQPSESDAAAEGGKEYPGEPSKKAAQDVGQEPVAINRNRRPGPPPWGSVRWHE